MYVCMYTHTHTHTNTHTHKHTHTHTHTLGIYLVASEEDTTELLDGDDAEDEEYHDFADDERKDRVH